jgi:hypothetical protein
MTFYAQVTVRSRGDRKDRVHRFYITDVADEAEARAVLKREESILYDADAGFCTFVADAFEPQEPGPIVVPMGTTLRART